MITSIKFFESKERLLIFDNRSENCVNFELRNCAMFFSAIAGNKNVMEVKVHIKLHFCES